MIKYLLIFSILFVGGCQKKEISVNEDENNSISLVEDETSLNFNEENQPCYIDLIKSIEKSLEDINLYLSNNGMDLYTKDMLHSLMSEEFRNGMFEESVTGLNEIFENLVKVINDFLDNESVEKSADLDSMLQDLNKSIDSMRTVAVKFFSGKHDYFSNYINLEDKVNTQLGNILETLGVHNDSSNSINYEFTQAIESAKLCYSSGEIECVWDNFELADQLIQSENDKQILDDLKYVYEGKMNNYFYDKAIQYAKIGDSNKSDEYRNKVTASLSGVSAQQVEEMGTIVFEHLELVKDYFTLKEKTSELIVDTDGKQIWKIQSLSDNLFIKGSYVGKGNFIIKLLDDNQDLVEIVANEIGDYILDKKIKLPYEGMYYIEIICTGGECEYSWDFTQ
ncbi:hypothetical protein [Turicibacter sanguinis]|uniref:hypothetical protein n=1 Tax=Turicibacter sanguinis TaxID=154288 RepID=UPI0012BB9EEA|nr:hypothetical protein [Turicibacter sanguinis]MCU7196716.1 hypothetical protein [Turicibacter sanguinis]MDB8439119.1 hypothetical protein [Turicibacter sanguinis]MTO25234.1 hypothetical protein [Turicibacter sanguinis]MTO27892.1 hypothetical protein [Turicibacter sanguinis]MTO90807.1 hypothetical protein [Turicibacter sanguinis]